MSRIYLASSWRNPYQADVLSSLRNAGHQVYDFKSTVPTVAGGPVPTSFSWAEIDPKWKDWTPIAYRDELLNSDRCASGYLGDFRGMEWADTCVMLLPCGRSAHIEAGYMKGRGKRLVVYYENDKTEGFDPDLMYLLADHIAIGWNDLTAALGKGNVS